MKGSPRETHPVAEAVRWVSILTTIGLEMVVPGLVGHWVDGRFGFRVFTPIGFGLGFVIGLWSLLRIARQSDAGSSSRNDGQAD